VPGHRILEYAESHAEEVLEALEDRTDAIVRDLEMRERDAARALRELPPPSESRPESPGDGDVPF